MTPPDFLNHPNPKLMDSSRPPGLLEGRAAGSRERMRFLGFLLMTVFFLLPVYLRPSGGLQLVDIPIVILIIWTFLGKSGLDKATFKYIISLLPFMIWVILINLGYFIIFSQNFYDYWYIIASLIIIYGFLQMYTFAVIFNKLMISQNIKYIYFGLICSIIGCLSLKGYVEELDVRPALSFNNPNQLAYFALVLMSYATILIQKDKGNNNDKISFIITVACILASHFFMLLSISRAGLIALLILDFCLLTNLRNIKYLFTIGTVLIVGALLILLLKPTFIQERLEARPDIQYTPHGLLEGHDGLEDRVSGPLKSLSGIEIIIGKGVGLLRYKFQGQKDVIEVHNTFLDVLRSYGIIGLLLFGFWYARICWGSRMVGNGLWVMAAIFAFNFGHNGIRFRFFWIFLAFIIVMVRKAEANYNKPVFNNRLK